MLTLLLVYILTFAFNFQRVKAYGSWVWVRDTVTGAYGEAVVGTGDAIYIAKGTSFYRYQPANNSWIELTSPPKPDGYAFKTGTVLAWDFSDYIYALYGAATDDSRRWFYRYNISNNSWEALANTTSDQGEGDAMTWVGIDNGIYATIGGEQRPTYFVRYDPSSNSWSDAPTDPLAGMGDGASLVWTGGNFLYALRGEFYEDSPLYDFWQYSLTENVWTVMADIPADPHSGGGGGVGDGGSLLYVGFWLSNQMDCIYALSGNQAHPDGIPDNRTYRYTVSMNTWERLADLPFGVGYYVGCRLGYADGHIYAWQGTPSTWAAGGDDLARYRLAWIVDDDGPADFHTIQEAINAANPGDTVFVRTGTYYEHIVINETLSVIGENRDATVIDDGKVGTVVMLQANHVEINGFTIMNSGSEYQGDWWDSAILLGNCNNAIIQNNNIADNWCGIWLKESINNTIARNNIRSNSMRGLALIDSDNNIVVENNITANGEGIFIYCSFNNRLTKNALLENQYNFGIFGETLNHFIQDIGISNTADDRPIYYWVNRINEQVPLDAGYVGLVNSTNIKVEGLNLTHNLQGVLIAYSTNSEVKNNELANNEYGASLVGSTANIIAENDMRNNVFGVDFRHSSNNTLSENGMTKNTDGVLLIYSSNNNTITKNDIVANNHGIDLTASNYNLITKNNITANNEAGIWLDYSSNNVVYHNSFVNNTKQARGDYSTNVWDNGYPSGGNYWSDYKGLDLYNGVCQNMTGSDGIGDTELTIDENNRDHYPLMGPLDTFDAGTWNGAPYSVDVISNSTVSKFQLNIPEKILRFNVTGETGSGFCRVTIPNVMILEMWHGNYTVLVNGKPWPVTIWTDYLENNTYIFFTYKHSEKEVTIIPEFPSATILSLLMVLSMPVVVFAKRKLSRRNKT